MQRIEPIKGYPQNRWEMVEKINEVIEVFNKVLDPNAKDIMPKEGKERFKRLKKLADKKFFPDWKEFKVKFKRLRGEVGDWKPQENCIYIHPDLPEKNKIGVLVHEFVEMVVAGALGIEESKWNRNKNKLHKAIHKLADKVEREVMAFLGVDWAKHQDVLRKKIW